MGALKAPKVSKIERIVCWCHFTRLLKLDKVSYFKIFNVINKKAEKTAFLFRIAPPHPTLSLEETAIKSGELTRTNSMFSLLF